MRVQNITDMIGNTPLLKIDDNIRYYAKIEGSNLFGSVKDRVARYLMETMCKIEYRLSKYWRFANF